MTEQHPLIPAIYEGWHTYQTALIEAIRSLTAEQLLLHAGSDLRTVGEIATHVVATRAGWFYLDLDERDAALGEIMEWRKEGELPRTAAELGAGLETNWDAMQRIIGGWTADQWAEIMILEDDVGQWELTRPWVVWHLIEHDLHHGGEISLTLGMHGVKAPDI